MDNFPWFLSYQHQWREKRENNEVCKRQNASSLKQWGGELKVQIGGMCVGGLEQSRMQSGKSRHIIGKAARLWPWRVGTGVPEPDRCAAKRAKATLGWFGQYLQSLWFYRALLWGKFRWTIGSRDHCSSKCGTSAIVVAYYLEKSTIGIRTGECQPSMRRALGSTSALKKLGVVEQACNLNRSRWIRSSRPSSAKCQMED